MTQETPGYVPKNPKPKPKPKKPKPKPKPKKKLKLEDDQGFLDQLTEDCWERFKE